MHHKQNDFFNRLYTVLWFGMYFRSGNTFKHLINLNARYHSAYSFSFNVYLKGKLITSYNRNELLKIEIPYLNMYAG